MDEPEGPSSLYEARKAERARTAAQLGSRANLVSTARVVTFLGAVVGVGLIVGGKLPSLAWVGPLGFLAGFFVLVVSHARILEALERAEAAVRYFEGGLARLAGDWKRDTGAGERFSKEVAEHPYADDLDLFGRGSLFQLVDRTATRKGEALLASWLLGALEDELPARTRERQEAIRELSRLHDLREKLAVSGAMLGDDKPDPSPFGAWAAEIHKNDAGPGLRAAAFLVPLATLTLLVLGQLHVVPMGVFAVPLVVGLVLTRSFRSRADKALAAASSKESALGRYGEMLSRIEGASFSSRALVALRAVLVSEGGVSATTEMKRLGRIVGFVDARENEFFRIFVSPVLLWDVHCAIALEAWRARVGASAPSWFSALSEMEAYASLATFAFENPGFAYPELAEEPVFEAKKLGHPLLAPGKRVGNDVSLSGRGASLVVTGSNMSGKSTLLRALGTNAVLARTGAPVCAERLVIGRFLVATSMRVRDSLDEGVSRFYAELKKLKIVLDLARRTKGSEVCAFFLLDEILHGTNTRERLIGARALVNELVACGASGAVSTHDLALGDLEQAHGGKVRNVHFEEQVDGETMTFDYALRQGVVQSSNALRLMRIVGLDVIVPDDRP